MVSWKFRMIVSIISFASCASAASVGDTIIQTGPHRGEKLSDVIANYSTPATRGHDSIHIPARAIQDAFDFYDCNHSARNWHNEYRMKPRKANPNVLEFDGVRQLTLEGNAISNQRYMVIFDLNQHSSQPRLHLIDLQTGEIKSTYAAHAKNTDCPGVRNGFACRFSQNSDEGDLTPLGFFSTGQLYRGTRGQMIGLNGIEGASGTFKGNTAASSAVIHGAQYVTKGRAGRSAGCPSLNPAVMAEWKDQLKDGALFYFYHSSLDGMDRHPRLAGAISGTCSAPPTALSTRWVTLPTGRSGSTQAVH